METISELLYYCQENEHVGALLLTGEWGCGKTYLIDHELREKLGNDKIIIRVTLFGVSSADEIHSAIKTAWISEFYREKGMTGLTNKIDDAKEVIKKLDFLPEWTRKVASIDETAFFSIGNEINGKKVVLVFDDLERCRMNMVDVLGIINDYCENQKYPTIIVANQTKITERQENDPIFAEIQMAPSTNDGKSAISGKAVVTIRHNLNKTQSNLSYQEIKEKIVQRTTHYVPNYSTVVHTVISDMEYGSADYKSFLLECEEGLLRLFAPGEDNEDDKRPHNIRSLKCAIQDFYRVYNELKKYDISNIPQWLYSFTSYLISYKSNIVHQKMSGSRFSDDEVYKLYPAYQAKYLPDSVKAWILHGIWDEKAVHEEIEIIKKRDMPAEPWENIRVNRIMDIEEDDLQKGFGEFLKHVYEGSLTLNDYVLFIENTAWAEDNGYRFPQNIEWEQVRVGINKQIEKIKESGFAKPSIINVISESEKDKFSEEAWKSYLVISSFRDNNVLMFYSNQRLYIEKIREYLSGGFSYVQNKRFDTFNDLMAEATAEAFIKEKNAGKNSFIISFKKMWKNNLQSPDMDTNECRKGLHKLLLLLEEYHSKLQDEPRTFTIIHTEHFMKEITALINDQDNR